MNVDAELEKKLDSWIEAHSDELLANLSSLVAIRSVSEKDKDGYPYGKGCHDVLQEAQRIAEGYGFPCSNPEDRYLLVRYGSNGGRKLGVCNHLDIVPEGDGWEHDPFKVSFDRGFLVGRGVADNKGAALASLFALRFLSESGIRLEHDVELFLGAAEETGMDDILCYIEHNEAPAFAIVPDSSFPVCYGEKGNLRFDLSAALPKDSRLVSLKAGLVPNSIPDIARAVVRKGVSVKASDTIEVHEDGDSIHVAAHGVAGHAAFPEKAVNAVKVLLDALAAADGFDDGTRRLLEAFAASVSGSYGEGLGAEFEDEASGKITAMGTLLSVEDGRIVLSFDSRTPVTVPFEEIEERIKAFAASHSLSYDRISWSHPAYFPKDRPEVQFLGTVADHVLGEHHEPYTTGGGTYARKLPAAVGFGPGLPVRPNLYAVGSGKGCGHQSDECTTLEIILNDIKANVLALIGLDRII